MEIGFFMDMDELWSLACKIKNVGKYLLHRESKLFSSYGKQTQAGLLLTPDYIWNIYMYLEYIYICNIFIYAIHILESKHRQAFVDTSDWSIEHRWLLHCINRSSTKLLELSPNLCNSVQMGNVTQLLSLTCFWDPYMVRSD